MGKQSNDRRIDPLNAGPSDAASAWRNYDAAVRKLAARSTDVSNAFDKSGATFGTIDSAIAERASQSIGASPSEPFISFDFAPGFSQHSISERDAHDVNHAALFKSLGAKSTWDVGDCLDNMRPPVEAALGTPWRVLSVRVFETRAENRSDLTWLSNNAFPEIFKALICIASAGTPECSLTIKTPDGHDREFRCGTGAWALFGNARVACSNMREEKSGHLLVEVTLCRAAVFDPRARFPGSNAQWPEYPWVDATGGANVDLSRAAVSGPAYPKSLTPPPVKTPRRGFGAIAGLFGR